MALEAAFASLGSGVAVWVVGDWTSVGAPLERALDEAAAACLDEYDADARLDHFRRLKRCVGEARDALGAALVADPRTPALHALRLALDWEGRFFSVEKPRARLSLGV